MLRIGGKKFSIDMLEDSHVNKAYDIWEKGTHKTKSKRHLNSGISFLASDAGFDNFANQVSEVIEFLGANKKIIRELIKLPDIDFAGLDFGMDNRINEDIFIKSFTFPNELVKKAGDLGLGMELSLYSSPDDE